MADFWTGVGDFLGLNKGKATSAAALQNQGLLSQLETKAGGYLDTAKGETGSLLDLVNKGSGLYADANGLNGTEGNARATSAFTESPGYQFSLDQGLSALERTAAAHGHLDSGNTDTGIVDYATGRANQEFGGWLDRLGGYQAQMPGAVAADTGSLSNLATFAGDISSGRMASNNQDASGKEANQGWGINLLSNLAGIGGSLAGYGGFGGAKPTTALRPGYQVGVT